MLHILYRLCKVGICRGYGLGYFGHKVDTLKVTILKSGILDLRLDKTRIIKV